MPVGLVELKEHRSRRRVETALYTGWAITRVFTCPKGALDAVVDSGGALESGTVLPAAYGGPGTTLSTDPRLQSVYDRSSKESAAAELVATWIEIEASS